MKNWTHMRILTKLTDVWNWKSVKKTLNNYQKRMRWKRLNENEMDKDSYENENETEDSKWDLIWTISYNMTHNLVCMPDIAVCMSLNAHSGSEKGVPRVPVLL